eukprot:8123646-Alexandrium_andersonii.AAC.1
MHFVPPFAGQLKSKLASGAGRRVWWSKRAPTPAGWGRAGEVREVAPDGSGRCCEPVALEPGLSRANDKG